MSAELVRYLGEWLLDHPGELSIEELTGDENTVVYEVRVHPEDMGKIIGKRGRIIQSIRTLARAAAVRDGQQVLVEVVD
jgi:predicted RNA-binding protein YlqC (UPF0109 family)